MAQQKVIIEALLTLRDSIDANLFKEMAAIMKLPSNDQKDLLFLSAILVSTGTNKNGAHFLGSELIKARDSIVQKPLTVEHKDDEIVGHICSRTYFDNKGNTLDDKELFEELAACKDVEAAAEKTKELDSKNIDIGIVCAVYKDRFPKIAQEIAKGLWKVSMECYYDDYDLKVGDRIVPKAQASKFGVDEQLNINLNNSTDLLNKISGFFKAARVLRDIRFCGVSIVKNPANERSIIMEAAGEKLRQTLERESLRHELKAAASVNGDGAMTDVIDKNKTEIVQVGAKEYFLMKNGKDIVPDSYNFDYNKALKESIRLTASSETGDTYSVCSSISKLFKRGELELNETSEATTYETDPDGDILQINDFSNEIETAGLVSRWGPKDNSAGICISYEKYLREFPGLPRPGRIVATHWCKLFNAPCPVLGAFAQDQACLRFKYSRMVKEDKIHGDALVEKVYNTTVKPGGEGVTLLKAEDMPTPIPNKISRDDLDTVDINSGLKLAQPEQQPEIVSYPATKEYVRYEGPEDDNIPARPLSIKDPIAFNNPYVEFPIHVSKISASERKDLGEEFFGLSKKRMYPLHTKERIMATMGLFPKLKEKLTSFRDKKELFNNIIRSAAKAGIDTTNFEQSVVDFKFKTSKGNNPEEFGIPRLKMFPLNNREQVIAAMSRVEHLKAEITSHEKDNLVVNILRAAKKFGVNAETFRSRLVTHKY